MTCEWCDLCEVCVSAVSGVTCVRCVCVRSDGVHVINFMALNLASNVRKRSIRIMFYSNVTSMF